MNSKKPRLELQKYPSIEDLKSRAFKRVPHIGWEYLDMGTGDDKGVYRNRDELDNITLLPRIMKGEFDPNTETELFGDTYLAPFGVAPIGLGGIMWPGAERILATTAYKYQIPYTLSTVASQTPEEIGPIAREMGWFQLYTPNTRELRSEILKRVKNAGFKTLVVTADVPAPSRRERASRAGLVMPPRITPRFIMQGLVRPLWSIETLKKGIPSLKILEKYANANDMASLVEFQHQNFGGTLSWDYLKEVRDEWKGPLILKGVLHPDDAEQAIAVGVDAIQVSNHGARQFNGAPAAINALPDIFRQVKGRIAILFDSGICSGLDIIRALALGADFVLLGRAFMFGVGAFDQRGGDHVVKILLSELKSDMHQLGVKNLAEIRTLKVDY